MPTPIFHPRLLLLLGLVCATPASSEVRAPDPEPIGVPRGRQPGEARTEPGAAADEQTKPRGIFLEDDYRFPRYGLLAGLGYRILLDSVAIPSTFLAWSGPDWAFVGGVVGGAVLLSVPKFGGKSIDVAAQEVLVRMGNGNTLPSGVVVGPTGHGIWTPYGSFMIYTSVATISAALMFVGSTTAHGELAEAGALAVEGMMVAEVYHIGLKLLLGREGPGEGTTTGKYYGPTHVWFPSGTPSGHASALGGFIGALNTYFDIPWLNVVLDATVLVLSVALMTDNLHYLSDTMVGLTMGYAVGRWVVHHRSSRFRNVGNGWKRVIEQVQVGPAAMPGGGGGIGAVIEF